MASILMVQNDLTGLISSVSIPVYRPMRTLKKVDYVQKRWQLCQSCQI